RAPGRARRRSAGAGGGGGGARPRGVQPGTRNADHRDRARPRGLPAGAPGKHVTAWNDIFLGVIAVATLAIAIAQIAVIVVAGRAARRVADLAEQFERDVKPLFGHLNAIGHDAARAAALAAAQVERVDRLFN